MATPILRYSPGGPVLRTVTPSVTTFTAETEDEESVNPGNPTPILDYTPGGGAPMPPWPPAPSDLTYPECGTIQLIDGQSWIDVTFANEKPDANWIFEELQIVNTTDPTSLNIWPGIVTVKSVTGFTIQLNGLPDTDNYFLHWAVGGCATSDWVVSSGLAATNFLQLTDTPDEYAGQAGMGVKVNETEDGLEFGVVSSEGTALGWFNVKDYGALGDTVGVTDAAISAGLAAFSCGQINFTEDDIGKTMTVTGAGAAGAPLVTTIIAVSAGTTNCTLDDAAATTVSGVLAYWGTNDAEAFRDAVAAFTEQWLINDAYHGSSYAYLLGSVPGGVIYIPQGNYYLGETDATNGFQVPFGNVKIFGDGIGKSTLTYSSNNLTGTINGFGICIGDGTHIPAYAIIEDLTLRDINAIPAWGSGGAIQVIEVANARVNRCEIINSKGNAAITFVGIVVGAGPAHHDAYVTDCIIRTDPGTNADAMNGDAINIGNYTNIHIRNNRIYGPGRHGFEGGGHCQNVFIEGNMIDMGGGGGSGINPTGGRKMTIANNQIFNMPATETGIDLTNDIGAFYCDNAIITGNYVATPLFGIKIQNTFGSSAASYNNFLIANNWVEAFYGITWGGGTDFAASMMVHSNRLKCTGQNFGYIDTPDAPAAGSIIDIRNNVCDTTVIAGGSDVWSTWHDAYAIKIEGNSIGRGLSDIAAYGGAVAMQTSAGTLAAGATLAFATYTTSPLWGCRVDDRVELFPTGGWSPLFIYWGRVTASNTVTVYVFNPTAGGIAYPGGTPIYAVAHRP